MKPLAALALWVCISFMPQAQNTNDPFAEAIKNAFNAQNPNESLSMLNGVKSLANKSVDSLRAQYYLGLGTAHGQLGNSDSSFYYLDQSEQIARQNNFEFELLKTYNVKGLVKMGMSEYEESLQYFLSALEIGEKLTDNKSRIAVQQILGNAGGIFYQLKDLDQALDYTMRSLQIARELSEKAGIAYNLLRVAIIYKDLDSLSQSTDYLIQSSSLLQELQDTVTLMYSENTIGGIYDNRGLYDSAQIHYAYAVKLAEATSNPEEIAYAKLSLADIHYKKNELSTAERIANEIVVLVNELNSFPNSAKGAYNILYKIAASRNQYKKALDYRNDYYAVADSISGIELKKEIEDLQTKYETAQKEAEIEKLTLENQLKDANLASARNAQFGIGIGGVLIIAIIIVYYSARQKRLKAEHEAQELQVEALKTRFMELHASPAQLAVKLEHHELNEKLNTPLSDREFAAFKLSLEGKTNNDIAEELFISMSTVKFHLRNAYSKLGVLNRKEAFQYILKSS